MRRLLLWLTLGITLTVLTTAGPLIAATIFAQSLDSKPASTLRLPATPTRWPDPNVTWRKGFPGWEELTSIRGIGIEHAYIVTRYRAGWPFATLEGNQWHEYSYDHNTRQSTTIESGTTNLRFTRGQLLPTGVIATNLLANLAIFTIPPILLFECPRVLRYLLRRKRHQCLACGYPIGPTPHCTECGTLHPSPSSK